MEGLSFEQWMVLAAFVGGGFAAVWQAMSKFVIPAWQERRSRKQEAEEKRLADEQEHRQRIEEIEVKTRELERLSAIGSRTFTEEQLTTLTSEQHTELGLANEFIRKEVSQKLDMVLEVQRTILDKLSLLIDVYYQEYRARKQSEWPPPGGGGGQENG